MSKKYEAARRFDASPENLRAAVRYALRRTPRKNVEWTDNSIRFSAPMSWVSWGEHVTVSIGRNGDVLVSSESRVRTTLVDWGKNRRNVEAMLDWMEEYLELHV